MDFSEHLGRLLPELRRVFDRAFQMASDDYLNDFQLLPEHLLVALIEENESVQTVFVQENIDPLNVVIPLKKYLEAGEKPLNPRRGGNGFNVSIDEDTKDIIADFVNRFGEYQSHGMTPSGLDLLHSFYVHDDRAAVRILKQSGLTESAVEFYLGWDPKNIPHTPMQAKPREPSAPGYGKARKIETNDGQKATRKEIVLHTGRRTTSQGSQMTQKKGPQPSRRPSVKKPMGKALTNYAINLNELAAAGKIDPLIGKAAHEEIDRAIQVLGRKTKNNPVFLGEPGVGKTARIEGLAQRIADGDAPKHLQNATVMQLNLNSMLAGTTYRGQFEQRMKEVMEDVEKYSTENGPIILAIDELHTLVGAGAVSGGSMDASNILKPKLARGEIRIVGGTTHQDYKKHILQDGALDRRFQGVSIDEPTPKEALEILKGRAPGFESHHGVKFSNKSLKEMVRLATRYMKNRHLPDSALDIMDEVGSMMRIKSENSETVPTVTLKQVRKATSKITKIPLEHLEQDENSRLHSLEDNMKANVFDQDEAIETIVRAYKRSRAGIREPDKTIGSFFFPGPSGSGKTETAKQLAAQLDIPLIRIDMSEYMEKHAVGRLIGSPKGYQGAKEGGQMTNAVRENPYSVLLLDEVEKAHPDVLNILLQLMDNGKVTDGWGNEVDFSNVVVIMTSNVGGYAEDKVFGFGKGASKDEDAEWAGMDEIRATFRTELLNRVDKVVPFNPLKKATMPKIVMREITELEERLQASHDKPFVIDMDEASINYLSEQGYDKANGARPLKRLIETHIGDSISDEVFGGALAKGGLVKVSFNEASAAENATREEKAEPLSFEFDKVSKAEAKEIKQRRVAGPAPAA